MFYKQFSSYSMISQDTITIALACDVHALPGSIFPHSVIAIAPPTHTHTHNN
jgi:hypothetical protein